jgi:hypothetical protein
VLGKPASGDGVYVLRGLLRTHMLVAGAAALLVSLGDMATSHFNSPAQVSREYKRHLGFAPSAT